MIWTKCPRKTAHFAGTKDAVMSRRRYLHGVKCAKSRRGHRNDGECGSILTIRLLLRIRNQVIRQKALCQSDKTAPMAAGRSHRRVTSMH